jgi:hypothetical protein
MKLTEHQRLLLPYDPPIPPPAGGKLPSIPQLWDRAKVMFARVIGHIGSTSQFSKRFRLTRTDKKQVLGWLEPVEKLARACLVVRAFSFLMITPQGMKLLRETPKIAMPEPPKPPGKANPFSTKIPTPGWNTIAQHQRALAERQKLDRQRAAERAARDPYDPANWGGRFRILGWTFPEPEETGAPPGKQRRPWIEVVEPNPWPACGSVERKPAPEKDAPALVLARRIEALARVIDNPGPAISRLARFIASLPMEALEPLSEQYAFAQPHWLQGRAFDIPHAAAHVQRAATIFCAPVLPAPDSS